MWTSDRKLTVRVNHPRAIGKGLVANLSGYWRNRRIGDCRLIDEIRDEELVIVAVSVAHRRCSIQQEIRCIKKEFYSTVYYLNKTSPILT